MACYTYKGKTYTKEELLAIKNQIIAENEAVFNQMGSEALNDVNVLIDQLVKGGLAEEVIVGNTETLLNVLDEAGASEGFKRQFTKDNLKTFSSDEKLNIFLNLLDQKKGLQRNPINNQEFIYSGAANLEFNRFDKGNKDEIALGNISVINKNAQNGSKIMKDITDVADELGYKITLEAKPFGTDKDRLEVRALVNFYKKAGFEVDMTAYGGDFNNEEEMIAYAEENPSEAIPMFRDTKKVVEPISVKDIKMKKAPGDRGEFDGVYDIIDNNTKKILGSIYYNSNDRTWRQEDYVKKNIYDISGDYLGTNKTEALEEFVKMYNKTIETPTQFQFQQEKGIKLIPTGFVKGKKVYINSDVATVETPIHEFAHLYNAWLKENKVELYNRGLELVRAELEKKNSPIQSVIDYVKSTQPNLQGEAFEEEVLTQLTGKKGLDLLQSKKKGGIIDWIKEALAEIANMLGLSNYSVEKAMNMTLDEFAKAIAVDLLRGESLVFDELYNKASQFSNFEDFADSMADFRDAHTAPSKDTDSVEVRLEQAGDFTLEEVAKGIHNVPDDFFDEKVGARYYGYDNREGKESLTAINNITRGLKAGKKDLKITAYRAIPKDIDVNEFKDYDWVTFSKGYAVNHGESRFGENEYKIIEQKVPITDLWWDGNDINEWGYDTGNTKKYNKRELKSIWDASQKLNISFQQRPIGITIEEAIKRNNGNPLNLAPNGKPSILYQSYKDLGYSDTEAERLTAQVYTDEFKSWFGDWQNDAENASKVVDKNKMPLAVYHFTDADFNTFKYKEAGFHFGHLKLKEDLEEAKMKKLDKIIPSFLSIKNLKRIDDSHRFDPPILIGQLSEKRIISDSEFENLQETFLDIEDNLTEDEYYDDNMLVTKQSDALIKVLSKKGIDGFVYENSFDSRDSKIKYIIDEDNNIIYLNNGDGVFKGKVEEGARSYIGFTSKSGKTYVITENDAIDLTESDKSRIKKLMLTDSVNVFNSSKKITSIEEFMSLPKIQDSFIALNPNQIKSATENIGTFSPTNADIRFQTMPTEEATTIPDCV